MRTFLTLLAALAGCYLPLCGLLWLLQEKMLFLSNLPGRALEATPGAIGLPFDDVRIRTGDNVTLHGWYVPSATYRGTLLFLHGNAGNISHRLDSIAIFNDLGLDVLIIDWRGYGQSEGRASEAGTYCDAEAAWRYLVDDRKTDPDNIIVFGRSLGGAVAARLASRQVPAGVIVESAFTSAADMAARLYPVFPVRLLIRLDYPTRQYLSGARCPVLVVHSRQDEIVPFDMGQALYAAAPEPKTFLTLSGDHNTGFLEDREHYVDGLDRFLSRHLDSAPDSSRR